MPVRLKNTTQYDGRVLRSIILRTHRALTKIVFPPPFWSAYWQQLVLWVALPGDDSTGRRSNFLGILLVPRPTTVVNVVFDQLEGRRVRHLRTDQFALMVWDELLFRMGKPRNAYVSVRTFEWTTRAFGEFVPLRPEKVKAKPTKQRLQELRYKRLLERKKGWLRKAKLADTKLKGIKKQERYYERELGL